MHEGFYVGIVNALLLVYKIIVGETTFLEHGCEAIYVLLGDTMANVDAYLVVLPVGNVLQQVLDVIGFLSPCNVFVLLVVKGLLYALALKDADAERGVFGRCASKEYGQLRVHTSLNAGRYLNGFGDEVYHNCFSLFTLFYLLKGRGRKVGYIVKIELHSVENHLCYLGRNYRGVF